MTLWSNPSQMLIKTSSSPGSCKPSFCPFPVLHFLMRVRQDHFPRYFLIIIVILIGRHSIVVDTQFIYRIFNQEHNFHINMYCSCQEKKKPYGLWVYLYQGLKTLGGGIYTRLNHCLPSTNSHLGDAEVMYKPTTLIG